MSFTVGTKVLYDRVDLDNWVAAEKAKSVRGGGMNCTAAPCRERSDGGGLSEFDPPDLDDRAAHKSQALTGVEVQAS
ncbi:hypothetical protein [Mycobacterium sp. ENV421]|uniref:hypothetical protein n=1 Tax=Mycobacterium sp. ENV421 TaxID=1213407 RepID=UPI0018EBA1F3|nr:hypothetical protein [Mycobacterium sp. ENV421]